MGGGGGVGGWVGVGVGCFPIVGASATQDRMGVYVCGCAHVYVCVYENKYFLITPCITDFIWEMQSQYATVFVIGKI